jgi:predicted CopG family antitoxin
MKTITINVSDPVYRRFQEYAESHDRTASELIREAMELYCRERIESRPSLRDSEPLSVGKVYRPYTGADDTLGEMLDDLRT